MKLEPEEHADLMKEAHSVFINPTPQFGAHILRVLLSIDARLAETNEITNHEERTRPNG